MLLWLTFLPLLLLRLVDLIRQVQAATTTMEEVMPKVVVVLVVVVEEEERKTTNAPLKIRPTVVVVVVVPLVPPTLPQEIKTQEIVVVVVDQATMADNEVAMEVSEARARVISSSEKEISLLLRLLPTWLSQPYVTL